MSAHATMEETVQTRRALLFTLLTTLAIFALSTPATAKRSKSPDKVFRGQIILSKKRFPYRFKSDAQFIKYMKKYDTKKFYADDKREWKFDYMIFSKEKIGTLQAAVTYYDITTGKKKRVNTFTIYPHDKNDKIISGQAELSEEANFEPHRKYLMVFSRHERGAPLAKAQFVLYPKPGSKPKKVSNEVNF